MNTFMALNILDIKQHGGYTEPLTKAESTRIPSKDMVENKKWKK